MTHDSTSFPPNGLPFVNMAQRFHPAKGTVGRVVRLSEAELPRIVMSLFLVKEAPKANKALILYQLVTVLSMLVLPQNHRLMAGNGCIGPVAAGWSHSRSLAHSAAPFPVEGIAGAA